MSKIMCVLIAFLTITMFTPLAGYAGPHGFNRGGGVWIGPGPLWDPYPYYIPPRMIIEPDVDYYMPPAPPQPVIPVYWYYCRKPEGYYPYVKKCPDGWMKVVPTTPSDR